MIYINSTQLKYEQRVQPRNSSLFLIIFCVLFFASFVGALFFFAYKGYKDSLMRKNGLVESGTDKIRNIVIDSRSQDDGEQTIVVD